MDIENEISNTSIEECINKFKDNGLDITHRYSSYDLCYNYFTRYRHQLTDNMEMSCYVLWSYLASWGMLRGSSFLLQKSPAYLKELIKYIEDDCKDLFKIDVDSYNEDNIQKLLEAYDGIAGKLKLPDPGVIRKNGTEVKNVRGITLVTKIMLGVFGCIPAYDDYFTKTFSEIGKGFKGKRISELSLNSIHKFYTEHNILIDSIRKNCQVKNFDGSYSDNCYTIAKIIDMYGFQQALKK